MIPVILSGGTGTRLWPLSRAKFPKQFCDLFEESLQNLTLKRLSQVSGSIPWILTSQDLRDFTEKKAKEAGFMAHVVYEPLGKNTAPAIAMLCRLLELEGRSQEIVGIFPADHLIQRNDVFAQALHLAELSARDDGKVVTLGIKPTHPATGYGYIQVEAEPYNYKKNLSSYAVTKFHEKPNQGLAQNFLQSGNYFWNAGIFVFQVSSMIQFFEKYQPQIWDLMSVLKADLSNLKDIYLQMPSISIDYAIMEKLSSQDLLCIPADLGWSDVGSWDAVAEVYEKNGEEKTKAISIKSHNNFVIPSEQKKYAFVGVDDLVIVDTKDALLIAKKGETENVKDVVEKLKKQKSALVSDHSFEERPWGRFEIISQSPHSKTKIMRVNPGQQISYQSHAKREEHWVIIAGAGELTLDGKLQTLKKGSSVKIPQGAKHRIRNVGNEALEFIEVQLGSYFGEDDIVRFEDDYNRI